MDRPVDRALLAMREPSPIGASHLKEANGDTQAASFGVSIIIPTKNRANDLARTIETLLTQTVKPLELIVVDQSPSPSFTEEGPLRTVYVHAPELSGAAVARNVAMDRARGDIWLFLDDDVLLEPDFIERILEAYGPGITGVSGVVTNYQAPPLHQRAWERIFELGPFSDERQRVYRDAHRLRNAASVRVRQFGAGLMSFRASAIRNHRFDENLTGASPGEDIDFCAGLPSGSVLLITPKARLIHNRSLENRDSTHWIGVVAQVAAYMRERHWKRGVRNNLSYAWLKVGYFALAGFSSLKNRSAAPWKAWREGARRGKRIARGSERSDARDKSSLWAH